jgi:hypothetical protein
MSTTNGENQSEPSVKIVVELESDAWHGFQTESLWAVPLGGDTYLVRNVPFYAKGLSHEDTVSAVPGLGVPVVSAVVKRGGHSTYRFILEDGAAEAAWIPFWQPIEEAGCTYERAGTTLFAVDVPPQTDIQRVYKLLEAGEKAGVWGFEEGHCGHQLN